MNIFKNNFSFFSKKLIELYKLKKELRKQNIFDKVHYVKGSDQSFFEKYTPIVHYVLTGAYSGKNPNYLFNSSWYLNTYINVKENGINPLLHYILHGDAEGKNPSPYLHNSWYKINNPDIINSGMSSLEHYLNHGSIENRDPNPYFMAKWYLHNYPYVNESNELPFMYYLKYGVEERQDPAPFFDTIWYRRTYLETDSNADSPLLHYIQSQHSQPTDPNPYFKSNWYVKNYPEIVAKGLDPILHYLEFGHKEGKNPNPFFDTTWYVNQNIDIEWDKTVPLLHYISDGWKQGLHPSPKFNSTWYKAEYLAITDNTIDPLLHFLNNEASLAYATEPHPFRQRSIIPIQPHYIDLKKEKSLATVDTKNNRIAIHIHFDTLDFIDDVVDRLQSITVDFDLFISFYGSDNDHYVDHLLRNQIPDENIILIKKTNAKETNLIVLIEMFGKCILDYDMFGHFCLNKAPENIHAQKSILTNLDILLGTPSSQSNRLEYIIHLLNEENKIVSVGDDCQNIKDRSGWSTYYSIGKHILNNFSIHSIESFPIIDMPANSMFWAKTSSLSQFLQLPVNQLFLQCKNTFDINIDQLNQTLLRLLFIFSYDTKGNIVHLFQQKNYLDDYRFYENQRNYKDKITRSDVKVLSYYLPQFHPIPENDKWHGKGFTEWTNVDKANPQFTGHYQQHIPHPDIGYYLLDSPEVLKKQADQMMQSGIFGQVFYHYWFSGKLILESTAQMLLKNIDIAMPFCFCWANENWTRRWDGNDDDILLGQIYSAEDALSFIRYLIPFFSDPRYIKIHDRPVLFIYRPSSFPDTSEYIQIWKDECHKHGIPAPYVTAVLTRGVTDPRPFGMDAGVERVLHDWTDGAVIERKDELRPFSSFNGTVLDYNDVARFYMDQNSSRDFTYFRSLVPTWDNTARYGEKAYVLHKSTPKKFQEWLEETIDYSENELPQEERFVVINAWNEWAEGDHLEPDTMFGYSYLNSVGRALSQIPYGKDQEECVSIARNIHLHLSFSPTILQSFLEDEELKHIVTSNILNSSIVEKCTVSSNVHFLFQTGERDKPIDYILEINNVSCFAPSVIEDMLIAAVSSKGASIIPNEYGHDKPFIPTNDNGNCVIERFWAHETPMILSPYSHESTGYERIQVCLKTNCFITKKIDHKKETLPEVTTIIRFHKSGDFQELINALYCLQAMQNCSVVPFIAAQDLDSDQKDKLSQILEHMIWRSDISPHILYFSSSDGQSDLRSQMLNESLQQVETRYVAFLDYDDRLMPHAYSWLIQRLEISGKAITYGRVYRTDFCSHTGQLYKRHKNYEYGFTYDDFINCNHAPLHSFMLDLSRLNIDNIEYVHEQKYMEDYYLMLQLVTKENADWDSLKEGVYIGDYMHSVDRLHTLAFATDEARNNVIADPVYKIAEDLITNLRQKLAGSITQ